MPEGNLDLLGKIETDQEAEYTLTSLPNCPTMWDHLNKSLDPYLKDLMKHIHQDYQKKLIQEYLKVSNHPYPNECLEIT